MTDSMISRLAAPSLRLRARLLATCGMLVMAGPLSAQSYPDRALQGDVTVVSGSVGFVRTPVLDTITIASPQVILNWNPETGPTALPPSPAPINFLPAGREALFQGAPGLTDYVVLNRILPSTNRPISFNGTVTSTLTPFAGVGAIRGGSVWFYSPGGIIAGPTSVFNVGNLILTANDIDATGGLFGPGGTIRFRGGAGSTSAINVQAGAQFNLTAGGSYMALVAPQVSMAGTATINGSAAYVAAEQVDIAVNGGLFNMSFLAGTGVSNALLHTGTTTGPATANGTIALAAMPRNTAITLLASGTLGYTPAATATTQNGAIVLSAGYDLANGAAVVSPATTALGNILVTNGNFTTSVTGNATNTLVVSPNTAGTVNFTGNVVLNGENSATVISESGETITVGGNLTVTARRLTPGGEATAGFARLSTTAQPGSPLAAPVLTVNGLTTVSASTAGNPSETGQFATGGTAQIDVTGGTLNLNGGFSLTANAVGGDGGVTGGNATGGTAQLVIAGGTVNVGGLMFVTANATGGAGLAGSSGSAIGGNASVVLNAGTSPSVLNLANFGHQISAQARVGGQFPSVDGGNARAGSATLQINSGTVTAIDLAVNASAGGGSASTGVAGTTSAGTARVAIAGGRLDVGTLRVTADESQAASDSGTSGNTTGSGLAAVDVTGPGTLNVGVTGGNSLTLSANGIVASAAFGIPPIGGTVVGGTARLTSTAGGTIFTDATAPSAPKPPVLLTADVIFTSSDPAVPSSTQRGGNVSVIADGGTMSLHKLDMHANAIVRTFANAGGAAGPSFGGTATLAARNGGTLTVRTGSGATPVAAYATGGTVAAPLLGTGGTIDIAAQGGTLALPDGLTVDARGFAGDTLGGTGGSITLRALAGTGGAAASLTAGATSLDASGQISAGLPNGTGGTITVTNTAQTMTLANLFARAGAANGAPSGSITLTANNAPITTTAAFTGIDLGTLGTLTLNAIGPLGSIVGSTGVFGFANDVFVSHTGVAAGAATTLTGPSVSLTAGRDQIHTSAVTVRTGAATLIGRRTLGGVASTILSTGDIRLGSGLLATSNAITFRTLSAAGVLGGTQGASSNTPEITTPGSFTVNTQAFAGVGNIEIRAGTGIDIELGLTSATGQILLSSTTGDVRLGRTDFTVRPAFISLSALGGSARYIGLFSGGAVTVAGASGIQVGAANGGVTGVTDVTLTSGAGGIDAGLVGGGGAVSVTAPGAVNVTTARGFGSTVIRSTAATVTGTSVGSISSPLDIFGATGINLGTAQGSTVTLNAPGGAVRVTTDLASAGALTVNGQSLFLRTIGNLTTGTLAATGAGGVDVATGGALTLTSVQSPLGPVTVSGAAGINVPTIVSGGATSLTAANGAIAVATSLQSAGLVTANGRSVALRGAGALSFGPVLATAGNVDIFAPGALNFTTAQASGVVALTSTGGNIALGTTAAGIGLLVNTAGTVTGTSATTTSGTASITGTTGIDIATVAGPTLTLAAPSGAVRVATDLRSAAPTISGQSLFLRSLGAMGIGTLTATGTGGIDAAAGTSLQMTSVSAVNGPVTLAGPSLLNVQSLTSGGATSLTATNGAISVGTALRSAGPLSASGQSIVINGVGPLTTNTLTGTAGAVSVTTTGGLLATGTTTATGAVTLQSLTDALTATSVQAGGTALLTAAGAVTAGTITSTGFTSVRAGTNVAVTNVQSGDFIQLGGSTTNGTITVGTAVATGYVEARAAALVFGNVTAGTDAILSSYNGALTVGDVTAGDDIFLTVNGSNANPATISPDSQTGQASTTQFALTAGNLRSTGLGSDTATSGPRTFTGAGPTGNVIRVRSSGTVQTGTITTPGTAIVVSDLASLATGAIAAPLGVGLFVSGNATTGDVTTAGALWIGNSTQNFLVVPSYTVANFGFFQTPTNGSATLGTVTSGILRASVLTNFNYASAAAATDILLTTGNATTVGGAVSGGALTAGTSLTVTAGNGATFTTANAGTTLTIGAGLGNLNGGAAAAVQAVNLSSAQTLTMTGDVVTTGAASSINIGANIVRLRDITSAGSALAGATADLTVRNVTTQGDTELRAGGTAAFTAINAGGRGYLNTFIGGTPTGGGGVAGGSIVAGLDVSVLGTAVALADVTGGTSVAIASDGGITAVAIRATDAVGLTAGTGSVTATSIAGRSVDVTANTGITVPTITSPGAVTLTAANGAISVASNIAAGSVTATGRSVFLRSTGALNLTNAAATAGTIDVISGGALTIGTARATGNIVVTSALDLIAGTITAGWDFAARDVLQISDLAIGGRDVTINTLAQAGGALTVTATGVATFNGSGIARFGASVASTDIAIGAGARFGSTSGEVVLTNSGTQQTIIGGTAGTGGYRLDATEFTRLFGRANLTINAPAVGTPVATGLNSSRPPDVVINGFTADAGALIGGEIEAIRVVTPGKIRVTGTVTINNANPGNRFQLSGGEAVEILDAGRIVMNGAGGLSGIIDLTSRNIVASSSAALADFGAAATLSAISDRAGRNDGAVDDGGYLQAGGIRATLLNSTLIIQNTGASTVAGNRDFDGRRGFTVGAGGFTIVQGGTNPVRIAINGRQIGATTPAGIPTRGGFVTGLDVIPVIAIAGVDPQPGNIFQVPANGVPTTAQLAAAPRLFDTTSTVNGCAITGGSGCRIVPNDPVRDVLGEDFGEGTVGRIISVSLIQLKDYVTPGDEPLIDEPVTGAGNDDLWSVDDAKPKCDPAKETCEAPR